MEIIRAFDLRTSDIDVLLDWTLRTKAAIPNVRIVVDYTRSKVLVNYNQLTQGQQFLVDVMLVEIT